MKRIVEIVPARPGWYARWQLTPDATRSYPVSLWALATFAAIERDCAITPEVIPDDEHLIAVPERYRLRRSGLTDDSSNKKETGLSPGLCEFNPSGRDYGCGT